MNKKLSAVPKTKTKDPESGIILEKVTPLSIDVYLGKLKLDLSGSITDRVRRLAGFMNVAMPEKDENAATCSCGGRSDLRFEQCPFCGIRETAPDTGAIEGGGEEAAIKELLERVPQGYGAPQATAQAPRRRRRSEGAEAQPEQVLSVVETPATELASAEPAHAIVEDLPAVKEDPKATVDQLDQSVARIHTFAGLAFEASYDLGVELADNFTRKLWLQRRTPEGKPAYSSWKDFVAQEVPIAEGYTYKLMGVTRRFDRNAFREVGITKLLFMIRVPEDDERLVDIMSAAPSMTLEEVKSQVTAIAGESLFQNSDTEIGKAISGKAWARAHELLKPILAESMGVDDVAKRIGVAKRTVMRWFTQLEEAGYEVNGSKSREKRKESAKEAAKAKPKKAPPPEKKAKKKAPPPEKAKPAKAPPAAPPKRAPGSAPLLMVPTTLGKTRIPLLVRAKKRTDPPKQAKRLADDPWCAEHLENGVLVRYVVHMGAKGLELIIDRTKS